MAKFDFKAPSFMQILAMLFVILISGGTAYVTTEVKSDGPIWGDSTNVEIVLEVNQPKELEVQRVSDEEALRITSTPSEFNFSDPAGRSATASNVWRYEKWHRYMVFVDYDISKIRIPDGRNMQWVRSNHAQWYHQQTSRVIYFQKDAPDVDEALKLLDLPEDQTDVVSTQVIRFDPTWVKVKARPEVEPEREDSAPEQ